MKKEEEYKELFLAEALDNYEEINRLITELEKGPDSQSAINAIFRITHTLKGNAVGMGFTSISELAHALETLFGEVREQKISLTSNIFAALFRAVDTLGALVHAVRDESKVSYKGIKTKLEVISKQAVAPETSTKKKTASSVPKTARKPRKSRKATSLNSKSTAKKTSDKTQISPEEEPPKNQAKKVGGNSENSEKADEANTKKEAPESKIAFSELIQVPVRKLDHLLNLVGELIIERDRMMAAHPELHRANEYARLHRISSDLQYSVMDVRLVQVGFLFNKFHRVVRDAAVLEQKQVTLKVEGADTEIDRNILQIISDSLIHLIRNAVAHGVESPEERKKSQKPAEGTITLKASNENDSVLIEIRDDGRGIDVTKVRERAVQRKMISSEQAAQLSEEETIMLIFEPGFSTVEQINTISGRGVGMDVVKKALDSIGGEISVKTEAKQGTRICLSLPSSMAVKSTLLFEADQTEYAIPLAYTEAVISLYKSDIHKVGRGLVASYLDKTISIVFLSDLFSPSEKNTLNQSDQIRHGLAQLHSEAQLNVIVVSYGSRMVGFVVDKLLQQKEIVEKPLMKPVDHVQFISGVTILGNGSVCLVLHVPAIISFVFQGASNRQKGIVS